MTDFALRRLTMVDTQVRPNDVTKYPIIEAMLTVPRETFVPAAQREAAYAGENVPLGGGRILFEPRTLSKMLDALDAQPDDRVLVIGAGLGYTAAVIARIAGDIIAVEERDDLVTAAQIALAEGGGHDVAIEKAPLLRGAPEAGPFDIVLIEGGIEVLPQAIADQVREGGRIGAIFMDGALGTCKIGFKIDGILNWRYAFNAAAPVLGGFARAEEFML